MRLCAHIINLSRLSFAISLLLVAIPVVQAEEVDNPQYQSWARHKVGTEVTMRTQTTLQGRAASGSETILTLKEITPEKVVVSVTIQMEMGGTKQQIAGQAQQIPAKIEKGKENMPPATGAIGAGDYKLKEIGKETIELAGKKYECTINEFESTFSNGKATGRIWNSVLVPGNTARMEMKLEGRTASTSTMSVTSIVEKQAID